MGKSELTEDAIIRLIARLRSSAANPLKADDIGYFRGGIRTYAATDSLIAGVHFRHEWLRPADIAWKLFARNWSDFLCKGIRPTSALLSLALTRQTAHTGFIAPFLRSLDGLLTQHGITLTGGDTAHSANDVFTLAFFGTSGKFLPRANKAVRPGDLVVQLGGVGGSNFALERLLKAGGLSPREKAFFARPQIFPLLPQAKFLKATIDQSDSILKSLQLLADANQARLSIDVCAILPSHNRVISGLSAKAQILLAAEDLAVFAIASPAILKESGRAAHPKGSHTFRAVGKVESIQTRAPRVDYHQGGQPVKPPAHDFEHFN